MIAICSTTFVRIRQQFYTIRRFLTSFMAATVPTLLSSFFRFILIPFYQLFTYHVKKNLSPCGLRSCKNRLAPFPGRMSYKVSKPVLSVLFIYVFFIVLLFIRASYFIVLLVSVGTCSVFWLFWLSYQYLQSDWLERLL